MELQGVGGGGHRLGMVGVGEWLVWGVLGMWVVLLFRRVAEGVRSFLLTRFAPSFASTVVEGTGSVQQSQFHVARLSEHCSCAHGDEISGLSLNGQRLVSKELI